ncbi:MAG: hypothetical protein A2017_07495 [Lentisphaerae bacterium GWF2_44_16]|nr:MAG: hypothetical protein A2017_07495 [Lentisphaerae bacterium GWF2_44_16]
MDNPIFQNNLKLLLERFPAIAEKLHFVDINKITIGQAHDGGIFYAVEKDGKWLPISDPVQPVSSAQKGIDRMEHRLSAGLSPAVVAGLYPGYILDTVYKHFKSRLKYNEPFRHIYVIVDSVLCLAGWLKASDRTEILSREEISFYWYENINEIVELCERDEQRSHLFIPLSSLPEDELNKIIQPLAELYVRREKETKLRQDENNKYYDAISDPELAGIIQGKAGRKPRLLMPTHSSSTVVQYSTRDTCKAFEKHGWETRILKMDRDLSPWRMIKTIYEFKPDMMIFINHLRTEDENTSFYPDNMMYCTWIQDAMSKISNKQSAEKWNSNACKRNRDFIVGYIDDVKRYGYIENRLKTLSMIVDANIFKNINPGKKINPCFECDVCFCSNCSQTTSEIIRDELVPALSPHGFNEYVLNKCAEALWIEYRAGKSYTSYDDLMNLLNMIGVFKDIFQMLSEDIKDYVAQKIFWRLNDVIYRHVILEWIDETGDIKMNIYGKGWEKHPRFAKYAKGYIHHGEELSEAYQAAGYCLHLNSKEGQHQRLTEIILSGGTPLIKRRTFSIFSTDTERHVLKKLALYITGTNGKIALDKEEKAIWNGLLYYYAVQAVNKNPQINLIELENIVSGELYKRIEQPDWLLAQWEKLNFSSREQLIELLRSGKKDNRITNVRLSQSEKKLTEIFNVNIAKNIIRYAMIILKQEFHLKLPVFSGAEKNILELTLCGNRISEMEACIERISDKSSAILIDAAKKISLFKPDTKKAREYLASVLEIRLSSQEKFDCAWLLAINGELEDGKNLIEQLYQESPCVKDGYATIARHSLLPHGDYKTALDLILWDKKFNRLSENGFKQLAVVYAFNDCFIEAENVIDFLYSENMSRRDVFAEIAYARFLPVEDFRNMSKWFEKDLATGRMTDVWKIKYAMAVGACGEGLKAETFIEDIYRENHNIKDGFSSLGAGLLEAGEFKKAVAFFEADESLGRSSSAFAQNHSSAYLAAGEFEKAKNIILKYNLVAARTLSILLRWHCSGMTIFNDYGKIFELLALDHGRNMADMITFRQEIIFNLMHGNIAGAEEAFIRALGHSSASDAVFIRGMYAFYSMFFTDDRPRASAALEGLDVPLLSKFTFSLAATACGLVGRMEKTLEIYKYMKSICPYVFLIKDSSTAQRLIFYAVTAHKTGNISLRDKCLEFSKANSKMFDFYYKGLSKFIEETPPAKAELLPDFQMPWD